MPCSHDVLSFFRLRLRIQLELEGQDLGAEHTPHQRWPESIDDLWQERLPHIRKEVYGDGMFMFDLTNRRYRFQENSSYGMEDEFMTDLMNEPEYGEGERRREGGEGEGVEKGDIIGDIVSFFEELDETEALELTIFHSLDQRLKTDPELKKKLLSAATLQEGQNSLVDTVKSG